MQHDAKFSDIVFPAQAAMRTHIYRCMELSPKDPLPDDHIEGAPLSENDPVRFVWERTARQSPHNNAMRKRVIADLRKHRAELYASVPAEDFAQKKKLETVFDQCFKTIKEKRKAQKDENVADYQKMRDDKKAERSRRRERKKSVSGHWLDGRMHQH